MPTYQKIVWIALVITVIAIMVLGYFLFLAPRTIDKAISKTELTPREIPQPANPAFNKPTEDKDTSPLQLDLNQSDPAVRELIASVHAPDLLIKWSRQKELLRSIVAAVDNVAQGQSPVPQLAFLTPVEKFSVVEKKGITCLNPLSYRRYDPLIDAFVSIPDESLIFWYKKLHPTLEAAFKELGYPEITFSQRLKQAFTQLIQVPLIREDIPLEKRILSYNFVDINLEELNPAQKHLLRLGPQNIARIQNKLRNLEGKFRF